MHGFTGSLLINHSLFRLPTTLCSGKHSGRLHTTLSITFCVVSDNVGANVLVLSCLAPVYLYGSVVLSIAVFDRTAEAGHCRCVANLPKTVQSQGILGVLG